MTEKIINLYNTVKNFLETDLWSAILTIIITGWIMWYIIDYLLKAWPMKR